MCARRRWLRGLCLLGRLMGPPVKPEGSRVYVFPLSLRLDRRVYLSGCMDCPVKPDNGDRCLMVDPFYYAILRFDRSIYLGRCMDRPIKPDNGGRKLEPTPQNDAIARLDRAIHRRCGNLRHTGKRNTTMYLTAVPRHPHPVLRIDLSPLYLIWGRGNLASPLPSREREGPAA